MTEVAARGNGVLVQVAPGAVKSPWSSSEATWAPCSGCHCWMEQGMDRMDSEDPVNLSYPVIQKLRDENASHISTEF